MYAIVDIETTGGYAAANGITEIAVALHDGTQVTDWFETLVNPHQEIPAYISGLTGITNGMVASAPSFKDISVRLFTLLKGRVFVAHNVNFDYSFVQRAFAECGIDYSAKRLCTIRLSRKIFPGYKSYSLGNLSKALGISLTGAHRAGGDTRATAEIFSLLCASDASGHIAESLKSRGELNIPPYLSREKLDRLPAAAGVYHFHDSSGKVIYVGKAIHIKKRVSAHFSGNRSAEKHQAFLREIHDITFHLCGNELIALLREAEDIRQLWPKYNKALKTIDFRFGIYTYEDGAGILRLVIEKKRKYLSPLISFAGLPEARSYMGRLVEKYSLMKSYCGLEKKYLANDRLVTEPELIKGEEIFAYNSKVKEALTEISGAGESFAILGEGRNKKEHSIVLVDGGKYAGFGFIGRNFIPKDKNLLLDKIGRRKETGVSSSLIRSYLERNTAVQVIYFS